MSAQTQNQEATAHYALAQDIKAGQTFVWGRGGKHWTALEDADTSNMLRSGNDLLVSIPVSFHGCKQGAPIRIPLDKIVRLIPAKAAA